MEFRLSKQKNVGMPARHISNQSFDEILSDLGDDPAIPDPHGIRKPPPPQSATTGPLSQGNHHPFGGALNKLQVPRALQGLGGVIALFIVVLIAAAATFFAAYDGLKFQSQSALDVSQQQISALKKEIAILRDELHQGQDDLYIAIEEIEVSIHSLSNKKPETRVIGKPQAPSYEAELRRWRYLGAARMGNSHQAFFNTGKDNVAFEKGGQILGDWRLSNIENKMATFTHPIGKSLILKVSSGE